MMSQITSTCGSMPGGIGPGTISTMLNSGRSNVTFPPFHVPVTYNTILRMTGFAATPTVNATEQFDITCRLLIFRSLPGGTTYMSCKGAGVVVDVQLSADTTRVRVSPGRAMSGSVVTCGGAGDSLCATQQNAINRPGTAVAMHRFTAQRYSALAKIVKKQLHPSIIQGLISLPAHCEYPALLRSRVLFSKMRKLIIFEKARLSSNYPSNYPRKYVMPND